ncbi:hypothetical protein [Simiduia agarivorans]|uniref:Lipoprotein n=1 Tax=Simiduia agarivorans (strain DSM 21679 / JCM 13881 / BCRC 17597 / SA1) TaxID=1117647 RepID=K4KME1_SIMAS|nr:hypothetical protein [Simiduia agarivorans]AFV00345.1 hypothetical protein M5M_16060 [Simiduia agarivorans SA1 = DSM 21679]
MKKIFAAATATLLFSVSAMACDKPSAPELPDPATAVTPQMIKAKNEVNAYIDAAKKYLDCVSGSASRHNAMVKEMEDVADKFNTAVREYKARMSNA